MDGRLRLTDDRHPAADCVAHAALIASVADLVPAHRVKVKSGLNGANAPLAEILDC